LPPGPKGHWLLGNLLQIPPVHYWLQLEKWAREFGPIYTIMILGTPIIVAATSEAGTDLLEKRSGKYSDRPRWVMANEILTKGMHVGVTRYGDRHRKLRKALRDGLHGKAVEAYWPGEELEARLFLEGLAKHPDEVQTLLKRFAASVILTTTYSHQVHSFSKDPYVTRLFASASEFARTLSPGRHLVDFLPFLQKFPDWVPGASWKRAAMEHANRDRTLYYEIFNDVKRATEKGDTGNCFVSQMLEDPAFGLNDEEIAYLAGNLSQAPDTLASVLYVFVLAMTVFPEKQRLAQEEIDRVIGRDRMPSLADRESLPYTDALVHEVLRWRPVSPLGVPHASTAPDMYNGYFIPEGTIVIGFTWGMHRDPKIYPDPDNFLPERHLTKDGKYAPGPEHTFGFGRRACPGLTLADTAAWIFAASTLWGFNINRAKDASGKEIIPSIEPKAFSGGGEATRPLPFPTSISPRPGALEMLQLMRKETPSFVAEL